jgi:hypothetical protein
MRASSRTMSHRAHFWLRLVALTMILAAEFAPRIWTANAAPVPPPVAAAVANAR